MLLVVAEVRDAESFVVAEDVVAFGAGVEDTGAGTEAAEVLDIIPTINHKTREKGKVLLLICAVLISGLFCPVHRENIMLKVLKRWS